MINILLYYFAVPIIIFILLWEIRREKNYLDFMREVVIQGGGKKYGVKGKFIKMRKDKEDEIFNKSLDRLKRLQIYFVIALVILLPLWNFSAENRAHDSIHTELRGSGVQVRKLDPVVYEVKPTFDIQKVYEEIEDRPSVYRPDLINKVVSLDQLTRYPGRLAIYRLYNSRIIITYTYLGVYPVLKAYGFQFIEGKGIIAQSEITVVYPMSPSEVASVADII